MIGYDWLYIYIYSLFKLETWHGKIRDVVVLRMAAINAKLQPFGSLDTHIFSALLDLTETEVLVDTLILNDSRDFFLNLTPEKLVIYLREYDII